MSESRNNQVILVTGAAKRIGCEIINVFHSRNFNVIIHYNKSAAEANRLYENLNEKRSKSAFLVQGDLNELISIKRIITLIDSIGRLDVLVNNASSFYPTMLETADESDWNDLINSNLKGPFFLSKKLAPFLKKSRGSIVNISDMHARQALKKHSIYSIAKAGNIAMTKSLALELAPKVRVNSVAPGAILWPAHEQDDKIKHNKILASIPIGRLGSESDIAETTFFLSNIATYVTGQTIAVDGGASNSLF
ncbi:MAG: pteridine reductase [Cellvibrionales bacterium TMED49]|nr:pteridine reductase [Porticoccaceae bacterium]OUU39624.1 MAG: pteridine reductase [Cellvibrionales bacterium TMED49]